MSSTSTTITVDGEEMPIRASLVRAIETAWQRLSEAGTWWTGEDRIALASQVRAAPTCRLCSARKQALSPYANAGTHQGHAPLSADAVDVVHRLTTDASRITERWVRGVTAGPLGAGRYVECISVVACTVALDTFDRVLGRGERPLPEPQKGEPSRTVPAGAADDLAWVPTVAPDRMTARDANPYPVHGDKNIHRALSFVPQEVFTFFDLDVELYLHDRDIRDFSREHRAISHAQLELIAGRASALNRCFY
jgi:hypothetical protein